MTNLAHLVGLTVVAEGVETAKQRDVAHAAGCELAQGYLYARPMSAPEVAGELDRNLTPST